MGIFLVCIKINFGVDILVVNVILKMNCEGDFMLYCFFIECEKWIIIV